MQKMVNGEGDWGFYGRKDELDTLERWMTGAGFRVYGVIGGRGVGKTTLIKQAGRQLRGKGHSSTWNCPRLVGSH